MVAQTHIQQPLSYLHASLVEVTVGEEDQVQGMVRAPGAFEEGVRRTRAVHMLVPSQGLLLSRMPSSNQVPETRRGPGNLG